MSLILSIDTRETHLISLIKDRDLDNYKDKITTSTEQLHIGDIKINYEEIELVIERKSLNDLLSSIKDGRYHEQKSRLLSCSKDITYIIEGDTIVSNNQRNQSTLTSVYIHSLYRDGIKVVFTKNTIDTATFILTLCTKIIDHPKYFIKNDNKQIDYIDSVKIKTRKIDNISPDTCFLLQLGQIPSISSKIAKNIQSKFQNMRKMISYLENLNQDERINTLCEIELIGKEKAKKILRFLQFE